MTMLVTTTVTNVLDALAQRLARDAHRAYTACAAEPLYLWHTRPDAERCATITLSAARPTGEGWIAQGYCILQDTLPRMAEAIRETLSHLPVLSSRLNNDECARALALANSLPLAAG